MAMKTPLRLNIALTAAVLACASAHGEIIIAENFGGLGTDTLNDTTADTFAAGITAAGGSNVWVADAGFKADGSTVYSGSGTDSSAKLNLGSYINDTKGMANGVFTLMATLGAVSGGTNDSGTWISVGYFRLDIPTDVMFASGTAGDPGVATALTRRVDSSTDFFPGPGSNNPLSVGVDTTGTRTYTIKLDLTAANYDGAASFGKVTFFSDNGNAGGYAYTFTEDHNFQYVGFSQNDSANSVVSAFSIDQIPEPGSAALLVGGVGMLVLRRRRE